MSNVSDMGGEAIARAKVTLVFAGYGILTLTDAALIWNKSASSFLAFGVASALTENHLTIPLGDIAKVGTYTYFPGGGLTVALNNGREYKIAFKRKKEFELAYGHLRAMTAGAT